MSDKNREVRANGFELLKNREWSFEELDKLSMQDLETAKKAKQDKLADVKREKWILISNILQLQKLIKEE